MSPTYGKPEARGEGGADWLHGEEETGHQGTQEPQGHPLPNFNVVFKIPFPHTIHLVNEPACS